MAFDLKNYEMVKDRIKKFYKENPDGRIITNVDILENTKALCKSFVYLTAEDQKNNLPKATGLAFEQEGFNNINMKNWVEVAETSAIGRALANMNLAGKDRPSREEMVKAQPSVTNDVKKLNGGVKNV